MLKLVKKLNSSSNGWCQYPFEQSDTVIMVAPVSLCAMSSGVQKQYGLWMMALLRLVGPRQLCSLGFPVLLTFVFANTRILIHGVALWTGFMTPALSILSISCLKISLRCTLMGLWGVCFSVTDGSVWMLYGLPGNLSIPWRVLDTVLWFAPWFWQSWFSLLCLFVALWVNFLQLWIQNWLIWIPNGQLLCYVVVLWIQVVHVSLSWDNLLHLRFRVILGGRYSSLHFTFRSCKWNTISCDRRTLLSSFLM